MDISYGSHDTCDIAMGIDLKLDDFIAREGETGSKNRNREEKARYGYLAALRDQQSPLGVSFLCCLTHKDDAFLSCLIPESLSGAPISRSIPLPRLSVPF